MNNNKKERKGFLPFISRIFSGSGSKMTSSAMGKGFFASLFGSKAAVVGVLLGGATIATGIGVIYNYIGPSSNNKVYTPNLFSDAYYQEVAQESNAQRYSSANPAQTGASSIDVFRKNASKDLAELAGSGENQQSSQQNTGDYENGEYSADSAPENPLDNYNTQNQNKLNASLGFNNAKAGSSVPKLQTSGGLWGGIGNKFAPITKKPAYSNSAKTSSMKKALASRIIGSPKYTVRNRDKKGLLGRAKAMAQLHSAGAYQADATQGRVTATMGFDTPKQTSEGDIGTPVGGAGIGGAGLTDGKKLKSSDPSLNMNEYQPPTPKKGEEKAPWEDWTNRAMYAMIAAGVLIAITKLLSKTQWGKTIAMVTAYAAMAAALVVVVAGFMLWSKYGQKWMGGMYIAVGLVLIWQAWQALSGLSAGGGGTPPAKNLIDGTGASGGILV